jgi:energy-coupling factor transport system substrate-specific component
MLSVSKPVESARKPLLTTREMAVFAMLGALMFCSKLLMEWAPNIHLLGMLTMTYTVTYRKKALFPLYVYVLLNGMFAGFAAWWVPYLYIWMVLWGVTMLLPRHMKRGVAIPVYMVVCALHGLSFGILYAPAQALLFGLNWQGMLAWIAAGFPFDAIHGASNLVAGALILPLSELLKKLDKNPC